MDKKKNTRCPLYIKCITQECEDKCADDLLQTSDNTILIIQNNAPRIAKVHNFCFNNKERSEEDIEMDKWKKLLERIEKYEF